MGDHETDPAIGAGGDVPERSADRAEEDLNGLVPVGFECDVQ
jgi:hypothetical protein